MTTARLRGNRGPARWPNPCPSSSKPFLAMSHSPCGPNGTKWQRIAPLNRRLGRLELYSQKYTVSPIRGSWMTQLLAPSSAKIRRERSPRSMLSADSIAQSSRRCPPDGGTPHLLPILDFSIRRSNVGIASRMQLKAPINADNRRYRSLDFRFEEFLRTRGGHVGLGDKGYSGIDIG